MLIVGRYDLWILKLVDISGYGDDDMEMTI